MGGAYAVECIKVIVGKLLGYAIILGSVMVKVPQILKISKAGSAEGISLLGVIMELVALTGTLAYSFANGFPFSSYGEATFMAFQQLIITFMVAAHTLGKGGAAVGVASYIALLSFLLSPKAPMPLLVFLQASVIVLVVVSRLTQAFANFSNSSTGQLSLVTILLQSVGSAVRILTSLQETGDPITILMYVVSTLTNGLLLLQIYLYWGKESTTTKSNDNKKSN